MDTRDRSVAESLQRDDLDVDPDEAKFAELLLLVAEELADDPYGGAAKANGVLYFAEFGHVRETGVPISGVRYRKTDRGPVPRGARAVRDQLVAAGDAALARERVLGHEQQRLIPVRPVHRELFSATELKAVQEAVDLLRGHTGDDTAERSRREPGWRLVDEGEDIPFVSALLPQVQPRPSARMAERMRQIHEEYARAGRLAE
ncbi:type II toxin-antitoxin system antitoxin SocA domain-containing protein [Pseudofrankia sp. DC12]|uniref:type II toxin-antitoxin system antitoxin SocA domain-containing protein n=1 Tax=Pseudofrankia sp. DC12 TaxID=683315 RepID=UPI0005F7BA61|nr:type II toxin-antitoxin system antitoxin SocA domain-containing protein [Pseudofrankia sp. DC12]